MTVRAYSYIRFSTPEQARGDSLRRQTEKAASWCAERGIELDDSLRDLGVSAYHGANRTNGALRSFLDLVESGKVSRGSYFIVESLDRISRETVMDAATRLFDLIRAGVIVVTLSDGQEYSEERLRSDWTPLVFSLIVMARAHEESRIKAERVGEAWKQKKAIARTAKTPITKRCPEWLYIENREFKVDGHRAGIVAGIFEATIEGFGRRMIARRLNELSIPPFRGKKGWQTSSIAKVLSSRAVLGEYQPHSGRHGARNRKPDGEPISDYYPVIIDEQTFWQAQAAIGNRKHGAAGRIGTAGAHILKGLAKCSECEGNMHIVNKGRPPRGGVYFVCDSAKRKMGCENDKHYRLDDVEYKVLHVSSMLVAKEIDFKRAEASQVSQVDVLTAQLNDKEAVRDRLLKLVAVAEFDDATNELFKRVTGEIKNIKGQLKDAKKELKMAQAEYDVAARKALLDDLLGDMKSDDVETIVATKVKLNSVLRTIVRDVVFSHRYGIVLTMIPRSYFQVGWGGGYHMLGSAQGMQVLLDQTPTDVALEKFLGHPITPFDRGEI
ncbi:recombinase family protein [Rhizobium leguminosarum]|uniref:recombinase family protein n=1 Tax=Rhizobium leguminosarum TaxID=384 RepID=UPI001C98B9F2|nr:recombinase family protein [Rhizobium leguminosarum]MBY5484675.1 recombinase family protein [Rhizobium leguminosarum]